jgi:hypothetical protein
MANGKLRPLGISPELNPGFSLDDIARVLDAAGIAALAPGQRVRFDCEIDAAGRLCVTKIALHEGCAASK